MTCSMLPKALSNIEYLERIISSHENDTVQHRLARAKLNTISGDIREADRSLQALLQDYDDYLPDDDFIYVNILHLALLAGRTDASASILNRRFGTNRWFRVSFDTSNTLPLSVVTLNVDDTPQARFSIGEKLRASDRFDGIINRWIWMLPVFAAYYQQGPIESGKVQLNMGDYGDVSGLAFCDNRPEYFLLPDIYYIPSEGYKDLRRHFAATDIPWTQRRPVALWRGATTGRRDTSSHWRSLPRVRLCQIGRENREHIDAGLSAIAQIPDVTTADEIRTSGLMSDFVPSTEFNKISAIRLISMGTQTPGRVSFKNC